MAMSNVGHIIDMIQMHVGAGGTNRDDVNEKLIIDLINLKIKDFVSKTKSSVYKSTVATADEDGSGAVDQEYELPSDVHNVTKVNFDSYEAHKITFEDVDRMKLNVS